MPAKLLVVQNWDKMTHLPQLTTGSSFGNFIYTTIVCNDAPHYHRLYQILSKRLYLYQSLEANLSSEDMK